MDGKARLATLLFVLSFLATGVAQAANPLTVTGTANIAFDIPLTINKNSDINFGSVKARIADTYTINTAGTVSHTGSGAILTGTPTVGDLTITGSTNQGITISAGNYIANSGVTPANARGKYGTGAEQSFPITGAAPGAGTHLKLGVSVTANGTQASDVTATPTFDITVVYQ